MRYTTSHGWWYDHATCQWIFTDSSGKQFVGFTAEVISRAKPSNLPYGLLVAMGKIEEPVYNYAEPFSWEE